MSAIERKKKKKHTNPTRKPKAPGARADELTLDLTNPVKANRVEWIHDLIAQGLQKTSIINKVGGGREPKEEKGIIALPKLSYAESVRYYNLAWHLLEDDYNRDTEAKRKEYVQRLRGLARHAQALGQLGVATNTLVIEAAFAGVGPQIGKDAPASKPADRPATELTEAELEAAIAAEKKRGHGAA